MPSLIQLRNLTKTYEQDGVTTPVLRGITCDIPAGQFLSVMGASGSGKSTLMHILGFLDVPTSGSYTFDDKNVASFPEDVLAGLRGERVGFVFQSFFLLPGATVFENVELPLLYARTRGIKREARVCEVVEQVGLSHRLHYRSHQLSGGERQRVAIARALVRKPSLLLADEPTGNLDSQTGKMIMHLLRQLHQEQGLTVVVVTHDLATATFAERTLTVQDGCITRDEARTLYRESSEIRSTHN